MSEHTRNGTNQALSAIFEVRRADGHSISDDPSRIDLDVVHGYLVRSYWSPGIAREHVEQAMRNSLSFGVYSESGQVGYARVVTDRTSFAYLADVFILEEARGLANGLWKAFCPTRRFERSGASFSLHGTRMACTSNTDSPLPCWVQSPFPLDSMRRQG